MLHITGYIEFITDVCTETFEDSCTDRMLFMIISHDMKAIDSVEFVALIGRIVSLSLSSYRHSLIDSFLVNQVLHEVNPEKTADCAQTGTDSSIVIVD